MRIRNLRVAAGGVVVLALTLTGCVGGEPLPTLQPSPTATPIFESEEEALAAAEEAYAAYLEMSNLISSEGGVDPERIEPFVSDERLAEELRGFESYRRLGIRTSGVDVVDVRDIQRFEATEATAEVVVYVCWDGSGVRILDSTGQDVTPSSREVVGLLEVTLVVDEPGLPLVVESDELWQSGSC